MKVEVNTDCHKYVQLAGFTDRRKCCVLPIKFITNVTTAI